MSEDLIEESKEVEEEEVPVKPTPHASMPCPDATFESSSNSCRMYEHKYPSVDDIVLVHVKSVNEMGAYVSLLEYDNIEGMVPLPELTRRRIRSVNKLIRVGRTEIVVVIRVDTEKGYIDLSKRRVSPEDVQKCETKYNKAKTVHSILRHVSETCKVPLIKLYTAFGWDLYKKFGHAFDAFKIMVTQPNKVLDQYDINPVVKSTLIKIIARRMCPQPVKIRADLEVTCFSYEGIEAIKAALKAGEAHSVEGVPIRIKLVAPPLFVMLASSLDRKQGISCLEAAIESVKKAIKERGGEVNVKAAPRAVTEEDNRALAILMETFEKQNTEISGDDD